MHFGKAVLAVAVTLSGGISATDVYAQPFGMGRGMMHDGRAGQDTHHETMHGMMHPGGHNVQDAQHGPMHGGTAGSGTSRSYDAAYSGDMNLVYQLLHAHERIERSVTHLSDGIRTLTESDDPRVAQALKAHVGSMMERLREGRVFNLFSTTLPILFARKEHIETQVDMTPNGVAVTQTSKDPEVVAALQGHAAEVSELARDGMAAMMRGMHRNMAMRPGGGFGHARGQLPLH
jgi:hypothetical protein